MCVMVVSLPLAGAPLFGKPRYGRYPERPAANNRAAIEEDRPGLGSEEPGPGWRRWGVIDCLSASPELSTADSADAKVRDWLLLAFNAA